MSKLRDDEDSGDVPESNDKSSNDEVEEIENDEDDVLFLDNEEGGVPKSKTSNHEEEEMEDDEDAEGDDLEHKVKSSNDDDEVLYLDSDDDGIGVEADKSSNHTDPNSLRGLDNKIIQNGGQPARRQGQDVKVVDEDDVMEVSEADPLGDCTEDKVIESSLSPNPNTSTSATVSNSNESKDSPTSTIVVNDTKSLVELAHSKKEPGKEPTLVIIDTNSILSGKGPVPVPLTAATNNVNVNKIKPADVIRVTNSLHIPDDAFLIEAPSFIVPYVFEQAGEKTLKNVIQDIAKQVKKENEEKLAKGEELDEDDEIRETKRTTSEDYFDSPVGKLLMNVGMNLVQEYVQVDLLKMQKRKAEKEREKSRSNSVTLHTQQSIMSLKKNIEESKENNEPFRHPTKKCELCNFKTESELVMSTHLETPHMRNYSYRCNFCTYTTRVPHEILFHMEAEHNVKARLERAPAYHQCPNCAFEDNSKAKLTRHLQGCTKRFRIEKNLEPPLDWDTPAKLPKLPKNRLIPQGSSLFYGAQANQQRNVAAIAAAASAAAGGYMPSIQNKYMQQQNAPKMGLPPLMQAPKAKPLPGLIRTNPKTLQTPIPQQNIQRGMIMRGSPNMAMPQNHQMQMTNNQILQHVVNSQMAVGAQGAVGGFLSKLGLLQSAMSAPQGASIHKSASSQQMRSQPKPTSQPSISITPLPRNSASPSSSMSAVSAQSKPPPPGAAGAGGKTSFVICEICDGYIKDLDQLRNHMQWIHKVKIHPKMIYNKPPLNCQKCQFRFFTDQGLERHLLGSHGLVTSSMQDAANKGQDSGRCPLCGKVYQWKLLAHVAKDHSVTLKPAHLSYKCTVCTATFGMYKLFESHVYSAHSMNNKGRNDRRPQAPVQANRPNQMQVTTRPIVNNTNQNSYKPLKINDEITIIPQPLANSSAQPRNKGSLTITPQSTVRRNVRGNDDDGIQIIEIDDAPQKSNGRRENGEFKGRLPISDSTLRKRNLEISVCGTDSDNNSSDESFLKGPAMKRLRNN